MAGYTVLGIALAVSLAWGANDQEELRGVARANCLQIEALKRHVRNEAHMTYANLDRTLRLLKLERTDEIERAALEQRDAKLAHFRERACP